MRRGKLSAFLELAMRWQGHGARETSGVAQCKPLSMGS